MNPFEKIFNYQIISHLEDSGTLMISAHERAWLKTMLTHPAATEAFHAETLDRLHSVLKADQGIDTTDHLIQKARSKEQQVYHPLLRTLRRHIMNREGVRISYEIKGGRVNSDYLGLPYKLEYSMVKREWYLLWYHLRHHALMSTKLKKIVSVSAEYLEPLTVERIYEKISLVLDSRKGEAVIEVVRDYNEELSRILYALSSFEKDVEYDAEHDIYSVKVHFMNDECEYLLSKIRFLGKRVRIVDGDYMKKRMIEASSKALARYGVTPYNEESS